MARPKTKTGKPVYQKFWLPEHLFIEIAQWLDGKKLTWQEFCESAVLQKYNTELGYMGGPVMPTIPSHPNLDPRIAARALEILADPRGDEQRAISLMFRSLCERADAA